MGYYRVGLPVSPGWTTVLWRAAGPRSTIVDVLGTRRQGWLDGIGQQRSGGSGSPSAEPIERLDPSSLAARIGMAPKSEAPAPRPKSPRSDGNAPWRKALRDS